MSSQAEDTPEPGRSADELFKAWAGEQLEGASGSFNELFAAYNESLQEDLLASKSGFSAELTARYGEEVDPGVDLDEGGDPGSGDSNLKVLGRLAERVAEGSGTSRYRVKGPLAEGGMGVILRVWDEDLRRSLAMKVMLSRRLTKSGEDRLAVQKQQLARFLEEAQVTGQLDHPNIVPVHELGLDPDGRAYFTMKLVKGRNLKKVFDLASEGEEGWNLNKVLGVLQKVCEAMSYAHDKGVIHRDLKPANVMVGRYGEVYVMDWGLAKILGRDEAKDVRIRPEELSSFATVINSDRRDAETEAPDSPLYTMDGDVVGTPAYMPPEQANGELEALGPRSDVYAVGAMLYHLLAGHMPYVRKGRRVSNYTILRWVQEEGPSPLEKEAPNAPDELISIANKAMARESSQRYPDMASLGEDIAAFVEGRVVGAHEAGSLAEARKWVRRNKALAGSLAAVFLALVLGTAISLSFAGMARSNAAKASQREQAERLAKIDAERLRDEARERERELIMRGLIQDLRQFRDRENDLQFASTLTEPTHVWWMREARLLLDGRAEDMERGLPWRPGLQEAEARLATLREQAQERTLSEIAADRRMHPRSTELSLMQSELVWHRRMLGDVSWPDEVGVRADLEQLLASDSAADMNLMAWRGVDPDTRQFGEELRARVLAERAVELASDDRERAAYLDTLAWARLFSGDLEGALEASAEAVEFAVPDQWEDFIDYQLRLEEVVEQFRGELLTDRAEALEAQIRELEEQVGTRRTWRLVESDRQWWHDQLEQLVDDLRVLRSRLDVGVSTVESPEAQQLWSEASLAISRSPAYGGLELEPQIGLLPLGQDRDSGLWEFVHLGTGQLPRSAEEGPVVPAEDTGIIFVLLPGGTFWMGAQALDEGRPNYDPGAISDEGPVHQVTLSPYFLAKHEVTVAQWVKLGGFSPRWNSGGLQPANDVSWNEAATIARSVGTWVSLPTGAQWEFGARGGTSSPWWTGDEALQLAGVEWLIVGQQNPSALREIGTGTANPYGLHDLLGNVREWCSDEFVPYTKESMVDPVVVGTGVTVREDRGGSFRHRPDSARVSWRLRLVPGRKSTDLGVRFARSIPAGDR